MPDSARPRQLVLASGSPRRRELLARLGVNFSIEAGDGFERAPEPGEDPALYALHLARGKAKERSCRRPDAVTLGADTVVTIDGAVLGKPRDAAHAFQMLDRLRGRRHEVITAVAVCAGAASRADVVRSAVWMRAAGDEELRSYVATGEPMDKAGAYAVQGLGGGLVERVAGCRNNVIGLPLCLTTRLLSEAGLRLTLPAELDPHASEYAADT